jgi:murein DD-endopeptidase MepM/ murein hydrolase activator NlpD
MLKGLTTCLLFLILTLAKANAGNALFGDVNNAKKGKTSSWKAKNSIRKRSKKVSHYRKSRHTIKKHTATLISSFRPQKIKIITVSTPEEIAMSNNFKKNHGRLPWPVADAKISTHFGRYTIPGTNGIVGDNPGLTFESEEGAQVQAVFDGEVTQITEIAGDSTIFVKHGKYYTTYSNLVGINVSKGQKVKVGDVLGNVGTDENGKGLLDFILLDTLGSNQDPEKWLAKKQ